MHDPGRSPLLDHTGYLTNPQNQCFTIDARARDRCKIHLVVPRAFEIPDGLVIDKMQTRDHDLSFTVIVNFLFELLEIGHPFSGFVYLENERSSFPEHERIDVLPACAVKRGVRGVHRLYYLDRDQFIHRLLIHLAGKPAPLASRAPALPAVPSGLRDTAHQFLVPPADVFRPYL